MLGIGEVIGEGDDDKKFLCNKNEEEMKHGLLPPGFRFHPTDEELIAFYLASKLFKPNSHFHGVNIAEVDLNRCEPWELPEEAKMGEREWYFFSLRVRKYPTGLRTNRATVAGYWKATGKDRQIYSSTNGMKLGTKKTLVFYKGGAPRGLKTKWVMHEFRLHSDLSSPNLCTKTQDEWVLCRIIHKSGEKIKTRSFQQQQTYLNKESSSSSLSVIPSSISLPQTTIDHHNNIPFQAALQHNLLHHRHENGLLESFLLNYPQLIFQSNLFPFASNLDMTSTHFPPPPTNADFLPQFNPPSFLDATACGSRDSSSAFVDVADYGGGRGESEDNWSGGC